MGLISKFKDAALGWNAQRRFTYLVGELKGQGIINNREELKKIYDLFDSPSFFLQLGRTAYGKVYSEKVFSAITTFVDYDAEHPGFLSEF